MNIGIDIDDTLTDIRDKLKLAAEKNAIENAYIKAKTYYDETKITTIGMDNNLYIEELPEEKQPGTHVRRAKCQRIKILSYEKEFEIIKTNYNYKCWKY